MFAGGLASTRVRDRKRKTPAVRRAAVLFNNQERLVVVLHKNFYCRFLVIQINKF